ncbi:ATP-grasp fold amidoligase family protein, partial [Helicobacter fennelliae]
NTNYYTKTREWHYDNIEPRVFVEEMLCEVKGGKWKVPENYRLFCFRENIFIQIDDANYSNTHKRWFYDDKWNFQVFSYNMPVRTDEIPKPATLEGMINIAKYLSNSIDFVRVDLYTIGTKIIAGELTLTPVGGTGKFTPKIWDKKLGDLWKIKA